MNWSIVLVFFLLAGCSREPVSKGSPAQVSETLPQIIPVTVEPRKLSKGEVLYIRECADCHGWEGRGNGPAADLINVPTPELQNRVLLAEKSESQFVDWVLYGQAMQVQFEDNAGPQTDSEITVLLAHIKKLPGIDWDIIDDGEEVYYELCVSCHGLYGHGNGSLSNRMPVPLPDLSAIGFKNQYSDEELLQIITKGKNAMPGVEDVLDSEEIKAVIAFVRLLSPGYESYDRFCAACHGSDGFPAQLVILNEEQADYVEFEEIDIPTFDDAYLRAHTDQQLIPKIQHMLEVNRATMPHFNEYLKPDEVRQIFQYLRSLIVAPS